MGENRVAQRCVGQSAHHCRLNRRHHLASFSAQRGESQNAVALSINEHFHKTTGFAKSDGSQYCGHWHLRQAICDAPSLRFRFVQADPCEFGIGEHAERYEAVSRSAAAPIQVVADHPEIVEGDVRELRAARAIAHRPNARRAWSPSGRSL